MPNELPRRDDRLSAICDVLAESVLEMTDAEAIEEVREAGDDPIARAEDVRALLLGALAPRPPDRPPETPRQANAAGVERPRPRDESILRRLFAVRITYRIGIS